jgi:hypothetical protein
MASNPGDDLNRASVKQVPQDPDTSGAHRDARAVGTARQQGLNETLQGLQDTIYRAAEYGGAESHGQLSAIEIDQHGGS